MALSKSSGWSLGYAGDNELASICLQYSNRVDLTVGLTSGGTQWQISSRRSVKILSSSSLPSKVDVCADEGSGDVPSPTEENMAVMHKERRKTAAE